MTEVSTPVADVSEALILTPTMMQLEEALKGLLQNCVWHPDLAGVERPEWELVWLRGRPHLLRRAAIQHRSTTDATVLVMDMALLGVDGCAWAPGVSAANGRDYVRLLDETRWEVQALTAKLRQDLRAPYEDAQTAAREARRAAEREAEHAVLVAKHGSPEAAMLAKLCKAHDWYYNYSDDSRCWTAGEAQRKALDAQYKTVVALDATTAAAIWKEYAPEGYDPPTV